MKMEKRKFRIGELSQQLAVEAFVIRFWEKEFSIRNERSEGGQRFYSDQDLATFKNIKELLYNQGFTIKGAKQQIKDAKNKKQVGIIPTQKINTADQEVSHLKKEKENLEQQVLTLQKQLIKLRELL